MHDNLMAGGMAAEPALRHRDPYTPENIANLVFECLQYLDKELGRTVALTAPQLDWGGPSRLSKQEFVFCQTLAQDLIPNDDESNAAQAESARNWLSSYFRVVMPGLGQLFRLGYVGFIQRYSQDTLPLVHGLAIVFEATYRLTCHLLRLEVIDKPALNTANNAPPLCVQYFMLDQNGLCRQAYYDRLVEHAVSQDRVDAVRALANAVIVRNALSHGAIVSFDEPTLDVIGRVLMHAIQLLAEAGMHHMVRDGAWYRWQDLRAGQHDFHETDWLAAERTLNHWILTKGRVSPG
jgi:hypothetical protein